MLEFIVLFISLPLLFYVSGHLLFCGMIGKKYDIYDLSLIERIFLKVLGSILITGWVGLVLAEMGHFSLMLILTLLLIFDILLIILLHIDLMNSFKYEFNNTDFNKPTLIFVIIIAISLVLFLPPYEWIIGGMDPGVYVNIGVNIAKTGSIYSYDALIASLDISVLDQFLLIWHCGYPVQSPGFYITDISTGQITPQFLYLWPAWIAIFYSLMGLKGSLLATSFFAVMSIVAFFSLTKLLSNTHIGLLASLLLSISYAQIFFAKYPASEMLSQFLLMSALYTFFIFNRTNDRYFGLISSLCFGGFLLNRIDSVLILIPIVIYLLYLYVNNKSNRNWYYFVIPLIILLIHTAITLYFISHNYLFMTFPVVQSSIIHQFIILLLSLMAGAVIVKRVKFENINPNYTLSAKYILIVLTISFVLIYYFITPDENISSNNHNLIKLSWYIGNTFGLFLALLGIVLTIYKKFNKETFFIFLILAIYSLFYIPNAMMTPDHPAWARRFLPVIIPISILFIAFAIDHVRNINIHGKRIAIFLAVLLIAININQDIYLVNYIEYENVISGTSELSGFFDDNDILIFDYNDLALKFAAPMTYIFDKNVIVAWNLSDNTKTLESQILKWLDAGYDIFYISPSEDRLDSFSIINSTYRKEYILTFPELNRSTGYLPIDYNNYTADFKIYQLE